MDNNFPVSLVFLETSEYVSCNFDYGNSLFKALKTRIDVGQDFLGITKVTLGEVNNKIHEEVLRAKQALQKARKDARILRNSKNIKIGNLFTELDAEALEKELIGQFEKYLKEFKVEILGYEELDVEKVFSLYFSQKAPFGKGKNKHEFPDAFSLVIREGWAESESSIVYVVSQDKDLKVGVKNYSKLEHVRSLSGLLSLLSFKYEQLSPLCAKIYEFARNDIDQIIKKDFSYLGFYVEDQQGDVNDIFDIEIEDYEPTLLTIKHEDGNVFAEFEVIAKIEFVADILYDDLATASYDSEDKVLIPHRTIEETVMSSEIVMSNVTLKFKKDSPKEYEILNVSLNGPTADIAVTSNENEDWPYK